MTRAEWLDYFETVNGRKPSVGEMAEALTNGEFVTEEIDEVIVSESSAPIKVEAEIIESKTSLVNNQPVVQEGQVTSHKPMPFAPGTSKGLNSKTTKIILGSILGVVLAIILGIGGFVGYRYTTGNIDGKWYSNSLGRAYVESMSSSLKSIDEDVESDISDYFSDTAVTMKVTNDTAKVTAGYTFDKKAFIKDYRAEVKEKYSGMESLFEMVYGQSIDNYFSEERVESYVDETLKDVAEDTHQEYDSKTGKTTITLFKGKVNRMSHKMKITDVDDGANLEGLDLDEGQELDVRKKDNKVILSGGGLTEEATFSTKNNTDEKF